MITSILSPRDVGCTFTLGAAACRNEGLEFAEAAVRNPLKWRSGVRGNGGRKYARRWPPEWIAGTFSQTEDLV
jgi:hypothetical protein